MIMPNKTTPLPQHSRLVIIGAGPIGLEAMALAVSRGWDVVLFEKGEVGHHLRQWGHVRLFTPFAMNHSDWGVRLVSRAFPEIELPSEQSHLSGHEYVQQYLVPLSRVPALQARLFLGAQVLHIGKEGISKADWIGDPRRGEVPFRLLIHRHGQELIHRTQAVLDCSGVYSSPRFLGNGNIPVPGELEARRAIPLLLRDGLVDLSGEQGCEFRGRRVLVVGGGYSAATALEGFQRLFTEAPETRVWWVNRSCRVEPYSLFADDPLPYRDQLGRLANGLANHSPPWLQYLGGSHVEEISGLTSGRETGFQVRVATPAGPENLEVNRILSHTGFMPDNRLYRQLQFHECYATAGPIQLAGQLLGGSGDCLAQPSPGLGTLANPEPHFFILGNKSYGTNNTFLLSHGISQVELVLDHFGGIDQISTPAESSGG